MKKNTKQIILDRSLELFSIKGYDGVSVKEIANAVGIKDSSLYKHYSSKQEIFDSLIEQVDERFEQYIAAYKLPQGSIEKIAVEYGENNFENLKKAVEAVFEFFMKDEEAVQFRRLVTIEQMKNQKASKSFKSWFLDDAIDFQTKLITELMDKGYLIKEDASLLALQFYAPFYTLLIKYDGYPDKYEEALNKLRAHIDLFVSMYKKEKDD